MRRDRINFSQRQEWHRLSVLQGGCRWSERSQTEGWGSVTCTGSWRTQRSFPGKKGLPGRGHTRSRWSLPTMMTLLCSVHDSRARVLRGDLWICAPFARDHDPRWKQGRQPVILWEGESWGCSFWGQLGAENIILSSATPPRDQQLLSCYALSPVQTCPVLSNPAQFYFILPCSTQP